MTEKTPNTWDVDLVSTDGVAHIATTLRVDGTKPRVKALCGAQLDDPCEPDSGDTLCDSCRRQLVTYGATRRTPS